MFLPATERLQILCVAYTAEENIDQCAGAAFKYIRDVLDEARMSQERSDAFKAAVLGSIADLAGNEPTEAAKLILERLPEDHASVVLSLSAQPELQYKYLQAATEVWLPDYSADAVESAGPVKEERFCCIGCLLHTASDDLAHWSGSFVTLNHHTLGSL